MTAAAHGRSAVTHVEMVTLTIDDHEISVPKGTLVIRAAELMGVQIPRFCDHPLLDPVGACRQCLVDVEGQRKPLASCTTTVAEGMVVRTQVTSESAEKAQRGVMELLLINHPLDCPVCDKGGECPLQNQAMAAGRAESRFVETKRTYPKPIPLSAEVLLVENVVAKKVVAVDLAAQDLVPKKASHDDDHGMGQDTSLVTSLLR